MRLLLDTHVFLWWFLQPNRMGPTTLAWLRNGDNEIHFSVASAWELTIKHAAGKLALPEPPGTYVASRLASARMASLDIRLQHALQVAALPPHHRDPFDRMLIAQTQVEGLTLITADPQLAAYAAPLAWATN